MAKKHIEEKWQTFARLVLPPRASALQVEEMKKAFYAGAGAMMHINLRVGEETTSEAEALSIFDAIRDELLGFADNLSRMQ